MGMIILLNKTSDPIMAHLNKRGVLTSYWVINDDDEINKVITSTQTSGLMTDRPEHARKMLIINK